MAIMLTVTGDDARNLGKNDGDQVTLDEYQAFQNAQAEAEKLARLVERVNEAREVVRGRERRLSEGRAALADVTAKLVEKVPDGFTVENLDDESATVSLVREGDDTDESEAEESAPTSRRNRSAA